jgi:hypothetical protein
MMSKSDPDAALVRKGGGDSRPRYQNHRVIDDSTRSTTRTALLYKHCKRFSELRLSSETLRMVLI